MLCVMLNVVYFVKCCVFCKMSLFFSETSCFVKCSHTCKILLTVNASLTASPVNTIINNTVRGHFASYLPLTLHLNQLLYFSPEVKNTEQPAAQLSVQQVSFSSAATGVAGALCAAAAAAISQMNRSRRIQSTPHSPY